MVGLHAHEPRRGDTARHGHNDIVLCSKVSHHSNNVFGLQARTSSTCPLIPLPRRFRTRTPRHTPLIPPPSPQPLLRPQLQLTIQLWTRLLPMNEIAESTPHTAFPTVQTTACFSEIGHGREFAVDGTGGVPARVERVAGLLGGIFVFETCIDVADEIYIKEWAVSWILSGK